MKIEEFNKYKKIAESRDPDLLNMFPEAAKVYNWMEETGRIDEGFWGSVWSWLKKNFSPTARKLYSLAEELEKTLIPEFRAEYGKLQNSKDLKSRFMRSFAGKMSEDIEEKMDIVAGHDDDYRELARRLKNKKKLKCKKLMLIEFDGELSKEDKTDLKNTFDKDEDENETYLNRVVRKLSSDDGPKFKEVTETLRKKINNSKRTYAEIGYASDEQIGRLVRMIIYYLNALKLLGKTEFNSTDAQKTLDNYVKFIMECSKKLQKGAITKEEAISATVKATEFFMKVEKPKSFDKMGEEVYKKAESTLGGNRSGSDSENAAKEKVTSVATPDILTNTEVNATIDDAIEKIGKKTPSKDEIIEEIERGSMSYFNSKSDEFLDELTKSVTHFNSLSTEDREKRIDKYNYELDSDNKLKIPTPELVKVLFKNLVQIAGDIVPYFNMESGRRASAFKIAQRYMFEIYAVKKDDKGNLTASDTELIIANIKKKYE